HAYRSRGCRRHRWLFRWTIARSRPGYHLPRAPPTREGARAIRTRDRQPRRQRNAAYRKDGSRREHRATLRPGVVELQSLRSRERHPVVRTRGRTVYRDPAVAERHAAPGRAGPQIRKITRAWWTVRDRSDAQPGA